MTGRDVSTAKHGRSFAGFALEAFALCFVIGAVNTLVVAASGAELREVIWEIPDGTPGKVLSFALTGALGLRLGWIVVDARYLGRRYLGASAAGGLAGLALAGGLVALGVPWWALRVLEGVFAW